MVSLKNSLRKRMQKIMAIAAPIKTGSRDTKAKYLFAERVLRRILEKQPVSIESILHVVAA
jgi:hypothetical protein